MNEEPCHLLAPDGFPPNEVGARLLLLAKMDEPADSGFGTAVAEVVEAGPAPKLKLEDALVLGCIAGVADAPNVKDWLAPWLAGLFVVPNVKPAPLSACLGPEDPVVANGFLIPAPASNVKEPVAPLAVGADELVPPKVNGWSLGCGAPKLIAGVEPPALNWGSGFCAAAKRLDPLAGAEVSFAAVPNMLAMGAGAAAMGKRGLVGALVLEGVTVADAPKRFDGAGGAETVGNSVLAALFVVAGVPKLKIGFGAAGVPSSLLAGLGAPNRVVELGRSG